METQLAAPVPSLDAMQLSSVAGIIVTTTVLMAVATRLLGGRPVLQRVPAFVYVTCVSLVLTVLANRVFKTLPGTTGVLLWDAAKAALASSGFYTWVTGRAGPIGRASSSDGPAATGPRPAEPPNGPRSVR